MTKVFIGLGSNLGDRAANLRDAEAALAPAVVVEARSSVYETPPQYVTDQPAFFNMVLRGRTNLKPRELLEYLKEIEKSLGREPSRRYGPRLIDLDLLYHGDNVVNESDLVVPHPRIAERAFVLLPMSEIAPRRRHPVTGKTTLEMLAAVRTNQ